MTRLTHPLRRIGLVLALALALGSAVAQPAAAAPGFGTSPGDHRAAKCASGTHYPDIIVTWRTAGHGPLDDP